MKNIFKKIGFLCTALLALSLGTSVNKVEEVRAAETQIYSTGFESSDGFIAGTTYNSTVTSGEKDFEWTTFYGTPTTTGAITGSQSLQMREYKGGHDDPYTKTNFKLENVTQIQFKAIVTDKDNDFAVYKSSDGINWNLVEKIDTANTSINTYTFIISSTGESAYFKIALERATAATSTTRLTIDDFIVNGIEKSVEIEKELADKNEINELIVNYKGLDSKYIKKTKINLLQTEIVKQEVIELFHAESTVLERTTYYNGNALWMTNGKGSYSYYGTNEDGDLTNATVNSVGDVSNNICIPGISMEEKYITLNDLIETNSESWEKDANGIYYSSDELDISNFLAFTAPCFLELAQHRNYIIFDHVEIEETEKGLELRLIVDSGNVGLLEAGTNFVFSYAIINYGWSLEYHHSFVTNDLGTNGEDISSGKVFTLSDVNWTAKIDATYRGYNASKGIQIGSGNNPASFINLSTNGFENFKILAVKINTSGASSVEASMSVTVDNVNYLCDGKENISLTATDTSYEFIGDLKGNIELNWEVAAKAIYIKSIDIICEI